MNYLAAGNVFTVVTPSIAGIKLLEATAAMDSINIYMYLSREK